MTQKNTGGPAFPGNVNVPDMEDVMTGDTLTFRVDDHPGMTLRDWFAGQALAGIMAFPGTLDGNSDKSPSTAASASYKYADAMIEAREK